MVVSGRPLDLSFRARILDHRAERNPGIEVREIGLELPEAVLEIDAGGVLADSLDFWLFSWLGSGRTGAEAAERLRSAIDAARADEMILVSSEIGLGPLPANRETREFADALGSLNQAAAEACDETMLVIAGRALRIG